MNGLIETAAALPVASALVNLFKFGWPSAPSWALALVSLVAGVGSTFVISLAEGHILTTQLMAQDVVQGVAVALAASGLDRVALSADRTRTIAKMEQARDQFEASGSTQSTPQ